MIGVLDIGLSNKGSLNSALKNLNAKFKYCEKPEDFSDVRKIILPGVGNFNECMKKLKSKKLDISLKDNFDKQKPILGICLGYQILFEKSNEGEEVEGLGLLKGNFVNFNEVSDNVKIPHTGWNVCKIQQKSKLFQGVEDNSDFYFTHSYVLKNFSTKDILTTTDYNIDFVSSVANNNLYGVQFHPEKSQIKGLKILKNFINFC